MINDPFDLIRATLEAQLATPATLLVASALPGDGKTAVAAGLARVLAAAGYRTVAIDASDRRPALALRFECDEAPPEALDRAEPRAIAPNLDLISIAHPRLLATARPELAAFVAGMRARYDFSVVDGSELPGGAVGLAREVDGVILAVRAGRASTVADREAVALLERFHAPFLGVVATERSRRRRLPLAGTSRSSAPALAIVSR
jgi:Mrp family chromosome partitioning ATPase